MGVHERQRSKSRPKRPEPTRSGSAAVPFRFVSITPDGNIKERNVKIRTRFITKCHQRLQRVSPTKLAGPKVASRACSIIRHSVTLFGNPVTEKRLGMDQFCRTEAFRELIINRLQQRECLLTATLVMQQTHKIARGA